MAIDHLQVVVPGFGEVQEQAVVAQRLQVDLQQCPVALDRVGLELFVPLLQVLQPELFSKGPGACLGAAAHLRVEASQELEDDLGWWAHRVFGCTHRHGFHVHEAVDPPGLEVAQQQPVATGTLLEAADKAFLEQVSAEVRHRPGHVGGIELPGSGPGSLEGSLHVALPSVLRWNNRVSRCCHQP